MKTAWARYGPTPRAWSVALTLAAGLAGAALLLWATAKWGIGANSDGLTYLVLARHWYRAGVYARLTPTGWKPMTHFPPGYTQAIVAFMPWTQGDPAEAARWVSLLALLGVVALAARQVYRLTRHPLPSAAMAFWMALAFPLQRVYTLALSENLFLLQILLLAWAVERWQEEPHLRRGVLVGLLVAWATFTRWIGGILALWVAWDMAWAWRRQRPPAGVRQALAALLAAGLPIGALMLAGAWVAPAATGRVLRWHPPDAARWQQAASTLADWVTPLFHQRSPGQTYALALAVLGGNAALLLAAWHTQPNGRGPSPRQLRIFVTRWLGFVLLYEGGLVLAISLADASTPMDWRLLAPVFLALSLLGVGAAGWVGLRYPWVGAALLLGGMYLLRLTWAYDRFYLVRKMHNLGAGLRNHEWQTADVWPVLQDLPEQVIVVTNELRETEYYADRPASPFLPPPVWRNGRAYVYDVVAGEYRPVAVDTATSWGALMARRWKGQCALIAYITIGGPPDSSAADQSQLASYFQPWQTLESARLWRPPDAPACYNRP